MRYKIDSIAESGATTQQHRINFNVNSFTLIIIESRVYRIGVDRRAVSSRCLFYAYVDSELNYSQTMQRDCFYFCSRVRRKQERILCDATVEGVPKSLVSRISFCITFCHDDACDTSMKRRCETRRKKKQIE